MGTFNLLAQQLATSKFFPYVQKKNLRSVNRKRKLFEYISSLAPSILLCQEYSPKELDSLFESIGYQIVSGNKIKAYGTAVCFDKTMFKLIDSSLFSIEDNDGCFVETPTERFATMVLLFVSFSLHSFF